MSPSDPGSSWRLGGLLGLTAFTLLLGTLFRNPQLVALAEALAVLIGLSWLACKLALRSIDCERRFDPQAFEDDSVPVSLHLTSRSWIPCYLLEVQDRFVADPFPLRTAIVQSLSRSETQVVRFERPCARGRGLFQLGPVELSVTDPMGLFRVKRTLPLTDEMIVYPRPMSLQGLDLEARLGAVFSGRAEIARAGQTTNFYGLREYRPGEPMQRIHWRASARCDRLVITEYEARTHNQVTLFLDLDRGSHRGIGRGSNVETAIRLAAALAREVLLQGHSLALVAEEREPVCLPARSGERQLSAILDALARVQPKGDVPYLELLRRGTTLIGEGGVALLVLNNARIDAEGLADVWAGWCSRRIQAAALVVDDRELLSRDGWGDPRAELPLAMDTLERFGIPAALVRTPDDVEQVVV